MVIVKRLYRFMLQTFTPLFLMTFFICMFIVIMQFLWSHIEDLVGKGVTMDVLAELFFYAALTLVPLALPLSILLASLMTFGNLGEHVELTAMKSSGISLFKVMRPLIVLISLVSIGAFFFQNYVQPQAQVKMWTLLFSLRQKSPALDIPEGSVYTQIPGYNLYVKKKNADTGQLYNVLIYDVSRLSAYPRIVAADSGRLSFTPDKLHLVLDLYHGNWYEEMNQSGTSKLGDELYRRETFTDKRILIPYDATFTRLDDETMRQQYVGKNISELQQTIDSVQQRVDSTAQDIAFELRARPLCGLPLRTVKYTEKGQEQVPVKPVAMEKPIDLQELISALPLTSQLSITRQALSKAEMAKQDCEFRGFSLVDDNAVIRRHKIEMQKKFTLSLACLIFFFIGAPLGAIIRKGGLGTPIVISVMLFIVYYIFDNTGYKMARDGRWPVWEGIWLSSAILLPLGIFLTYKAINDSAVFNPDAYRNFFRRITGLHQVRKLELKEVVINEVEPSVAISMLEKLNDNCTLFLSRYDKRQSFLEYWGGGYDKAMLTSLQKEVDEVVDYLGNSREQIVINKVMDFPVLRNLLTYHPTGNRRVGYALGALLPLSVPFYLIGIRHQRVLRQDISTTGRVARDVIDILERTENSEDNNDRE